MHMRINCNNAAAALSIQFAGMGRSLSLCVARAHHRVQRAQAGGVASGLSPYSDTEALIPLV
jgi:hypothetical protein